MHRPKDTNNSRKSVHASPAVSVSDVSDTEKMLHSTSHRTLKHKQILKGNEICSRFDQISGHRVPRRMTTGKFVYLGPGDKSPETPL